MRTLRLMLLLCAAAGGARPIAAQDPPRAERRDSVPDPRVVPAEVSREVTDAFNAPGALRATGPLEVPADSAIHGDIAVLDGTVTVAGTVAGRIVAINSDVILRPGARVEGEILVVGGRIDGKEEAFVGGDTRVYRQRLDYRRDGDRLVASDANEVDERWWRRHQRRWRGRTHTDLRLVSARTYNRVEGLPILIGPSIVRRFGDGRFSVDALGIFRTADDFSWQSENLGHSVKSELRLGHGRGIAIGGHLFDVVEGAEDWQLTDTEVGLASFFLHRDYRDYYDRHGGSGFLTLRFGEGAQLTTSLSDERWGSRDAVDVFTLFRNNHDWRPNPAFDEGRLHIANATFRVDTRNDPDRPWSGWYLVADYERGSGDLTRLGATSPGVRDGAAPGRIEYSRGFLDVRRYNRISPDAQLNLRFVAGGWLDGDELPLQRRFSLGGPGTLPGYDFRRLRATDEGDAPPADVGMCGGALAPFGAPAQCERMALAQLEYRGDLRLDLFGGFDDWDGGRWDPDAEWILFADAGRGWLVGEREGELTYPRDRLPSLGTWRTDVGIGLSFGKLGFYIAKSVTDADEPPNFFVRLKRRF